MKIIYPNEKVSLKKGGRSSDKLTSRDFIDLIKHVYEDVEDILGYIADWEWNNPGWIFHLSKYLIYFGKDLKYEFNYENVLTYSEKIAEIKESDIKFTAGGTPYLELYCCGIWEEGLLVYVYPSHNTLRAYIPTKGNTVRKDLKCVFGDEAEMYSRVDRLTYLQGYAKEDLTEDIEVKINPSWCLEDFEIRLGERI